MHSRFMIALGAVLMSVAVVGLSACGGDDDSGSEAAGNEADGTFITGMVPHHESAIEMAEIAAERSQRPEIQQLAGNIIATQGEEISQLQAAHERLFGEPLENAEHGGTGTGTDGGMSTADMAMLEDAPEAQFDQVFIDMMVPHHQDAIEMARAELADGEDAEMKELANAIISAQSGEIEEMNSWRQKWYGASSPAGGVPPEDESTDSSSTDSMGGMGH